MRDLKTVLNKTLLLHFMLQLKDRIIHMNAYLIVPFATPQNRFECPVDFNRKYYQAQRGTYLFCLSEIPDF